MDHMDHMDRPDDRFKLLENPCQNMDSERFDHVSRLERQKSMLNHGLRDYLYQRDLGDEQDEFPRFSSRFK